MKAVFRHWSKTAMQCNAALAATAVAAFAFTAGLGSLALRPATASPAAKGLCDTYAGLPSDGGRHAGMVQIRGGRFTMGSNEHYGEEARTHEVHVDSFWIDQHDITNAQFALFVKATGYLTVAERQPDLQRHPDLPPAMQVPGSVVFVMGEQGRAGHWRYVAGANWKHPQGPTSSIADRPAHPVVHIAYEDAQAYARWRGRDLPTEAQWEYAARGGLQSQAYVWGNELAPKGVPMANTWNGPFPLKNTGEDGYLGTSPVGCYPANGYGLYDMAGNVWQWTATWYKNGHSGEPQDNPVGPNELDSFDPRQPGTPAKVIKGGSHLCAANYCMRYRSGARQPQDDDLGSSHLGFRTILRAAAP